MMMRTLVLLNLTLIAFAQAPAEPELRGTVTEFGVTTPVAGAEVTISEFVVIDSTLTRKPIATIYTDNRGAFVYKPGHIGRFGLKRTATATRTLKRVVLL